MGDDTKRALVSGAVLMRDVSIVVIFAALALLPWESWIGGRISLANSLAAPSGSHPFGTDNMGRDLLVRVATAIRGGVLPLWFGVLLASMGGVLLGLLSILLATMRKTRTVAATADVVAAITASIPVGLLAFGWAAWHERAGLLPVILSLSLLFAVRAYLETRDLFRHDVNLAFWSAHAAMGGSLASRLWHYGVIAGWKWSLMTSLGFHLRAAVAIEASLSYLGFGIQEPQASFGNMLSSHFDLYLHGRFEVLIVLCAALAVTAAFPGALIGLISRLKHA